LITSFAIAVVFFLLGFSAHRLRWHEWLRPYTLYALGRAGGCSLAVSRSYQRNRIREAARRLEKKSKILKADGQGFELWGTPRGFFWVPSTMTSFLFILAEQEAMIYGSGEFRVRKGDIVLDCGANVGVFTSEALAAGAELVVAIEPVPGKVECLRRNFEAEIASGKVILFPKGIWHEEGVLEMSIYKNCVMDSFVLKDENWETLGVIKLPVTTLDRLVQELALPRVDFIKMDLEGAVRNALEGVQETLAKYRPRLAIATEDREDDYLVVPDLVRRAWPGYRFVCGSCHLRSRFQIVPDVLHFS
jgi:FkbM family methyltransferase